MLEVSMSAPRKGELSEELLAASERLPSQIREALTEFRDHLAQDLREHGADPAVAMDAANLALATKIRYALANQSEHKQ